MFYAKFKRLLLSAAIHFKKLNMTIKEFYTKNYVSIKPYEKSGSVLLIQAVKEGSINTVLVLLKENKLLVHDFDYVYFILIFSLDKQHYIGLQKGINII